MAKSSDIIKIGFDYRASLEQFVKETNGVFDGISEKAGKQRISIQLDAKNDKVIEKIKELQKLKLDKFTFEFGESGLAEQLKTFDQLEKKITEIINLSKGLGTTSSPIIDVNDSTIQIDKLQSKLDELSKKYDELSSKKINSSISGKDIDLVDNEEFKRLSDEFSLLKDELTGLKREMQLFEEATVSADTFVSMEHSVNGLIVKVDDLIDKYVQLSVAQKNVNLIETNISSPIKDTFQGDEKISAESSTIAVKEESKAMEQVAENAEKAANGKEKFTKANKNVKASADASVGSIEKETSALDEKEWEKNVKAIQEYMDANTKLNQLNAKDKGTGKHVSEIAYQVSEVEKLEKVALEARAALSSMINPHEAPIDDWNKWLEAMKQFDQATEGSARSVAKLEDALRNMAESQSKAIENIINSNQSHLDKLRPTEGNRSVDFEKSVQEYNKAIIALREFHATLDSSTPLTNEQSAEYEKLSASLQEARVEMEKFSAAEKGSTESSRWKEIDKITKYLEKNTRISKEARQQLEAFVDTLKNVSGVNVEDIHMQFNKIAEAERVAGREGKRFWDILTDKAVYGAAAQLAGYYLSLTDFIRYGKQMVDTVIEIDTALTELRKVSDATEQRLTQNFKNSAETAKDLGASISDVISATSDWARMGYDVDASEELARVSTLYVNVGDGIDTEDANNSLISTLQGYQMVADEAESVVDKFNEVSNNFAITSGGIGEALQRSAASFNAANTDLSKSIALITATNEVVQNPESVGTLWKTLSARIRGAKTELEDLGEETDEYTESTSKLRDLVKGLTGFDIMADEDTFKDIYEIILGIGKEWDNLTDIEQASLGEALAGKRNANALYAVLGNLDTLQEAYQTAEESAGSAMREQENYEKSIQYSLDRLTASTQEWSATLVDSGVIKWFVDLANAIVEVSTAITPLGTLALGGGLFAGIKNVGINTLVAY